MTRGTMGFTAMDPTGYSILVGRVFPRVQTRAYFIMPFDPVLQAAWFKLFGVHAFAMRSLHILLGLAALTAWGSLRQLPQAKAVRYAGCSCREHSTVPLDRKS